MSIEVGPRLVNTHRNRSRRPTCWSSSVLRIALAVLGVFLSAAAWPALAAVPAAQGNIRIMVHRSETGIIANRCDAILLASDAVLMRASCFDFAIEQGATGLGDFDVAFDLGPQRAAGAAFVLHESYRRVDCTNAHWQPACERATSYCDQRFVGLERNWCKAQREFYARTFTDEGGVNLALVYLSTFIDAPVAAVAEADRVWYRRSGSLLAQYRGQSSEVATPLRVSGSAAWLPFVGAMRPDANLWAPTGEGNAPALLALGSHFASLPLQASWPSEYAFTRVDAQAGWIERSMQAAAENGDRRGDSPLQRMPFPLPLPSPSPAPAPTEPGPDSPSEPPELPPSAPAPADPNLAIPDGAEPGTPPQAPSSPEAPSQSPNQVAKKGLHEHDEGPLQALSRRHGCQRSDEQQWAWMLLPAWPWLRRRR